MAELTKEYNVFILSVDPKNKDLWDMFEKHLASFWTHNELKLHTDINDWRNKLNEDERQYIKYILAFFASSDGIVNMNLLERFMQEITIPEAKAFYACQYLMETVHSRTYAILLETYIEDKQEREHLFNSITTVKSIKMKADWTLKWINDKSASLAQRLLAFIIVEGVFFSGSFCGIFWLKKMGLMPGLCQSNELISRDEGLHYDFGVYLYITRLLLSERLSEKTVHEIMESAMECEREFIKESLPKPLNGMNSTLMIQYVEYVADRTLTSLGYSKLYNSENPFDWMNLISVDSRTNFFERPASEYQKYSREDFEVLNLEELK